MTRALNRAGPALHLIVWGRREGKQVFLKTIQQAKRVLKIVFGFTLLLLGAIMVISPGPGWLTIVLGLGILAAEFVWARRLLDRMKQQGVRLKEQGIRLREAVLSRSDPATPR